MGINKVQFGNDTLIDLTGDTVTAADLPSGVTAHDRSGVQITGSANYQPAITANGILKGDGAGNISAAVEGTDYTNIYTVAFEYDTNQEKWTCNRTLSEINTAVSAGKTLDVTTSFRGRLEHVPWAFYPNDDEFDAFNSVMGTQIMYYNDGNNDVITEEDYAVARAGSDASGNFISSTYATISSVPSAYTSTPAMDGTGSAGSSTKFARGDHVHPTDTSRQAQITADGILKNKSTVTLGGTTYTISAAVAGTDYQAPITASGLLKGDGAGGVTAAVAGTDYDTKVYITTGTLDAGISSATQCTFTDTFATIKAKADAGMQVVLFCGSQYVLPLVSYSASVLRFDALMSTRSMASIGYASTDTSKVSTDITYSALQKVIHQDGAVSLDGMLKGNGSKVLAATAGTDYMAPFTVEGTTTSFSSNPTVTVSTTFAAMSAAYTAGKTVSLKLTYSGHAYFLPLVHYQSANMRFGGNVTATQILSVNVTSSDTVTATLTDISLINANGVSF